MKRKPHIISRAEFARRAGRSRSSVTEACAGPLAPACVGRRIDAASSAARTWAAARGIDPDALLGAIGRLNAPAPHPCSTPEGVCNGYGFWPRVTIVDGADVFGITIAGEVVVGTFDEARARAAELGARVMGIEGAGDDPPVLIDLDHTCYAAWLASETGHPITAAELDRQWAAYLKSQGRAA